VAGACGCGNVPTVSIKFGKFFFNLGHVRFFRKDSAAREFRNLTAMRIIRTPTMYYQPPSYKVTPTIPAYSSECLAAVDVQYLVETTAPRKRDSDKNVCHLIFIMYVARNTLIVVRFLAYFFFSAHN
jgi:hypothetical protein